MLTLFFCNETKKNIIGNSLLVYRIILSILSEQIVLMLCIIIMIKKIHFSFFYLNVGKFKSDENTRVAMRTKSPSL
jgi:hypothetical protein